MSGLALRFSPTYVARSARLQIGFLDLGQERLVRPPVSRRRSGRAGGVPGVRALRTVPVSIAVPPSAARVRPGWRPAAQLQIDLGQQLRVEQRAMQSPGPNCRLPFSAGTGRRALTWAPGEPAHWPSPPCRPPARPAGPSAFKPPAAPLRVQELQCRRRALWITQRRIAHEFQEILADRAEHRLVGEKGVSPGRAPPPPPASIARSGLM